MSTDHPASTSADAVVRPETPAPTTIACMNAG
jgi:hypothetical protein